MVDWQMVASVFCMIAASLVAVIYGQISHALTRISARLDDLARLVHGHEIRINMLDDDYGR